MSNKVEFEANLLDKKTIIIPELELYIADDILTNKTRYNIAIQLYSRSEEGLNPLSVLTTNLGEFVSVKNAAYIDTNNNGANVIDWLIKNGFGQATQFTKHSGFCEYPLFVFNEELLKKIDYNNNYEKYEKLFIDYYKTFDGIDEEHDEPDICE